MEGDWKFDKSADVFGRSQRSAAWKPDQLVFDGDVIRFGANCVVRFNPVDYFFSDVFQPLTKQGMTDKQLNQFLMKSFGVTLQGVSKVYALAAAPENCARPIMEFFVIGERVLVPVGAMFHSFSKRPSGSGNLATGDAISMVSSYKLSTLPMDVDRYHTHCEPKIVDMRGRPKTTDKCAPDFFPYVADPKSKDALMQLVGNHDYEKNGLDYAEGFSAPFAQKVAATFLVFPPKANVILVRVDDFEVIRNEERDRMSGVYLSIIGGKVVDQIWGCHIDRNYQCVSEGRVYAKLMQNGKFQRVPLR